MTDAVAIVAAAGSGERLGAGAPKAFVDLAGRPILDYAVAGLLDAGVKRVVVAVPAAVFAEAAAILGDRAEVVAGGPRRSDTVRLALEVAGEAPFVVVHDAARPLTPPELIRRVLAALRAGAPAVVPVIELTDTIKAVDANGAVLGTPERSGLRSVQTPQGFRSEVLRRAYAREGAAATDDSALVENLGVPVQTVAGDQLAFKITTPLDLRLALAVLGR